MNRSCDTGWSGVLLLALHLVENAGQALTVGPYCRSTFFSQHLVCVLRSYDHDVTMIIKYGNRLKKKTTQGLIELLPTSRAMGPIWRSALKLSELIQQPWSMTSLPTSLDTRPVRAKAGAVWHQWLLYSPCIPHSWPTSTKKVLCSFWWQAESTCFSWFTRF